MEKALLLLLMASLLEGFVLLVSRLYFFWYLWGCQLRWLPVKEWIDG